MNNYGMLYAIGVGPGDPDLLTLAAVKALAAVDVVFAASSTKNEHSVSLGAAKAHLRPDTPVRLLGFPMTRDKDVLKAAWVENARAVLEVMGQGKSAAFLTLGDPLTYSTFGYLWREIRAAGAERAVKIIPGITSYQAAAAASGTVLAEGGENLVIISGISDPEKLKQSLDAADNAVILKTYRNFPRIREALEELGLSEKAQMLTHCGLPGQEHHEDLALCPERPRYLSLILLKKN